MANYVPIEYIWKLLQVTLLIFREYSSIGKRLRSSLYKVLVLIEHDQQEAKIIGNLP